MKKIAFMNAVKSNLLDYNQEHWHYPVLPKQDYQPNDQTVIYYNSNTFWLVHPDQVIQLHFATVRQIIIKVYKVQDQINGLTKSRLMHDDHYIDMLCDTLYMRTQSFIHRGEELFRNYEPSAIFDKMISSDNVDYVTQSIVNYIEDIPNKIAIGDYKYLDDHIAHAWHGVRPDTSKDEIDTINQALPNKVTINRIRDKHQYILNYWQQERYNQ